jgi:hypothetical protein
MKKFRKVAKNKKILMSSIIFKNRMKLIKI